MNIQKINGQQRKQLEEGDHNDIFYKHKHSTTLYIILEGKFKFFIATVNMIDFCSTYSSPCLSQVECRKVLGSPSPYLCSAPEKPKRLNYGPDPHLLLRRHELLQQLSHKDNESLCF